MKPWLETWAAGGAPCPADYRIWIGGREDTAEEEYARRDLAIAAPEMCRALLLAEWTTTFYETWECPLCECTRLEGHADCPLDTALTKAGLPDQASRDAARKELGI